MNALSKKSLFLVFLTVGALSLDMVNDFMDNFTTEYNASHESEVVKDIDLEDKSEDKKEKYFDNFPPSSNNALLKIFHRFGWENHILSYHIEIDAPPPEYSCYHTV